MPLPDCPPPPPLVPSAWGLIGDIRDSETSLPSPGALQRFSVKMEGLEPSGLAGKLPEALAVQLGELGSRGCREEEPRRGGGGEVHTAATPR